MFQSAQLRHKNSGKSIMVLETQQSSDTTYRFYDWDRVDQTTGQKRPLQIKKSMYDGAFPRSSAEYRSI
ncbi:hypothetical protein ACLOBS_06425 [Limosilactobacillus mucosae]|uniref:hypothetical protein n=2 Tax=Limosilactobacillus mucosae TaxID=97478 RepID=UPI003EBEA844